MRKSAISAAWVDITPEAHGQGVGFWTERQGSLLTFSRGVALAHLETVVPEEVGLFINKSIHFLNQFPVGVLL